MGRGARSQKELKYISSKIGAYDIPVLVRGVTKEIEELENLKERTSQEGKRLAELKMSLNMVWKTEEALFYFYDFLNLIYTTKTKE